MSLVRLALVAAIGALLLHGTACGITIDGAYKISRKTYSNSVTDSSPTAESIERTEYEANSLPDASYALTCHARTRQIERHWDVDKTYEYRGGFRSSTYVGAAIFDGVVGAIVAGSLLGICTSGESDISCVNMVWAAPWAVDAVYSLIRAKSVGDPVLINKRRWPDQLQISETPISDTPIACTEFQGLWVGRATGRSDDYALEEATSGPLREMSEGAVQVSVDANGVITFPPEATDLWARDPNADLWVNDAEAEWHRVKIDRCSVLRPLSASFDQEARTRFAGACPLPQLR